MLKKQIVTRMSWFEIPQLYLMLTALSHVTPIHFEKDKGLQVSRVVGKL